MKNTLLFLVLMLIVSGLCVLAIENSETIWIQLHTTTTNLNSLTPNPLYEYNNGKIKIQVENNDTSNHSINKVRINTTLLNITSSENPTSWNSSITSDQKMVEWNGGLIESDSLNRFTFYADVPDLNNNQIESLIIYTQDTNGDSQTNIVNLTLNNDSIIPTYTINNPKDYLFYKNGTLIFNINYTETESGLSSATVKYDYLNNEGDKNAITGNILLSCNSSNYCVNTHLTTQSNKYLGYYLEVKDKAGNKDHTSWSDANWHYVYIDDQTPVLSINTINNSWSNSNNYYLNYNLTDNSFAISSANFHPSSTCNAYLTISSIDNLIGSKTVTNNTYNDNITVNLSIALNDGNYNWHIHCNDSAGWEVESTPLNLLIDRYPPSINLTGHNNNAIINNNTILIFNISDVASSVSSSWWISGIKNGILNTVTINQQYSLNSSNLNPDLNNLEIYANDTHSNLNNFNYTIYVDAQAPIISLNYPNNATITTQKNIKFTATDNYASTFNCSVYLDNTLQQTIIVNNNTQKELNLTLTSDKDYNWNVQCIDNVNNFANSETRVLIYDTTAPIINLNYPNNTLPYNTNNINTIGVSNFTYNYQELHINTCSLYIDNILQNTSNGNNFTNINFGIVSKNDAYTWYISCNDSAGNLANSSNGYVYYDNLNPVIDNSSIQSNSISESGATIIWNNNETSKNKVYYGNDKNNLTNWMSKTSTTYSNTSSISLTALTSSSTYYYYIESCDQFNQCTNNTNSNNYFNFTTLASSSSSGGSGSSSSKSTTSTMLSVNKECTESWSCGSWTNCVNEIQSRTCTDKNSCGTTKLKPALSRSCKTTTNTDNNNLEIQNNRDNHLGNDNLDQSLGVNANEEYLKNTESSLITGAAIGLKEIARKPVSLVFISLIVLILGILVIKKIALTSRAIKLRNKLADKLRVGDDTEIRIKLRNGEEEIIKRK